jgi:hypothetical protein
MDQVEILQAEVERPARCVAPGTKKRPNLNPHFERTATLGFSNQHDYESDLDEPKWLER